MPVRIGPPIRQLLSQLGALLMATSTFGRAS